MNKQMISDVHKQNKSAMLCYSVLDAILILAYVLEVVKGDRTIAYFAVFCALAVVSWLTAFLAYKKNPDSKKIRGIIAYGFAIFYAFVVFTTTSILAYVYAFMIAVILVCYSDVRLTTGYMAVTFVINVAHLVYMIVTKQFNAADMPTYEIQILSIVVYALFMVQSTTTIRSIDDNKVAEVEGEKEHATDMMQKILTVADKMRSDIVVIQEKAEVLGDLADKNLCAMEEVTNGNNETVNSVQMQMLKTNEIKEAIEQVEEASTTIVGNVEDTKAELDASKASMDSLIKHVNISYEANANVSKELAELSEYTSQMESIISLINGITNQTSLLSLNASIEAARAGEAGRGFAVVASEISNLASQTQQATVNITDLINNISTELAQVVNVVEEMIQNANEQNEAANETAASFERIAEQTEKVSEKANDMSALVRGLTGANNEIIKGIETISAVAEEVTANSNMTYESSSENKQVAGEIGELVEELNASAKELEALEA